MTSAPRAMRTFLTLWSTQSVSVFGDYLTVFGLNLWLTQLVYPAPEQRAPLALALAALNLGWLLPGIVLSPLAGVWVDRLDRRKVMLVSNVAQGLVSAALFALLLTGTLSVPLAVVLAALQVSFGIFHEIAFESSYVMVVPEAQLTRAGGMMQTTSSLARIVAPGLGALLVGLPALLGWRWSSSGGVPLLLGLDVVSFAVAALPLLWLRIPSPESAPPEEAGSRGLWREFQGAWQVLQTRPALLGLLGTFALLNVATFPVMLFETLLLKVNLLADAAARGLSFAGGLALMAAAYGFGGIACGVLLSTWGGLRRGRVYGVFVPVVIAGAAEVLLGTTRSLPLGVVSLAVMGACLPFINAHSRTIWSTQVPPELQGRVYSLRRVIAQASGPLSLAAVGWLAGSLNPGVIAAALGVFMLLVGAVQLLNPATRHIEQPLGLPATD